jgi:hypothetical protein
MAAARPFPSRTLEHALRIPRALKEKNGGNPWPPEQVAEALGIGATSGNFFYLAAASRDYGLTTGSRDTKEIAITELGRRAVYPGSDAAEKKALVEAFLTVDTFRQVIEHYGGNNLPEKKFLANTLGQNFGIKPDAQDKFVEIFDKDCRFLGIGKEWSVKGSAQPGSGEEPKAESVTIAEPENGGSGPVCFVIMPFTEHDERYQTGFFKEVLVNVLTPAAVSVGFRVETALRQGSDVIQSTIVNELLQADLVLADLTEHNPNVLFELGMRMHLDKPVALVRAMGTGQIFDVDNMLRVAEYNPNVWPSTVERDVPRLADHIKATWENRDSDDTFMKILHRQTPVAD